MVYNFRKLSKASSSIAMTIIYFIFVFLLLFLGLKYEGRVLVGFIVLSLGFVMQAVSSIFSFIKCRKFGNDNFKKSEAPKNIENKADFNKINSIISIFSIIFAVFLVVGIILIVV